MQTVADFVVMDVAGCGKSTLGAAFAARIGAIHLDGDDLLEPAYTAKMARGEPRTYDDRCPWFGRVGAALDIAAARAIGCSALRRSYRDRIRAKAARPVMFIDLEGDRELIAAGIEARTGHFMPASLLESHLTALQAPDADEFGWVEPVDQPLDELVSRLAARAGTPSSPRSPQARGEPLSSR